MRHSKKPKFVSTTANPDGSMTTVSEFENGSESDDAQEEFDNSRTTPFDYTDDEKNHHTTDSPCWGCMYHFGRSRTKNATIDKIYQVYLDNCSDGNLTEIALAIFKKHEVEFVKQELLKGNLSVVRWPLEKIIEHLKLFILAPKRIIENDIRRLSIIQENMNKTMFKKGSDQIAVYDRHTLNDFLKVQACKFAMINSKILN